VDQSVEAFTKLKKLQLMCTSQQAHSNAAYLLVGAGFLYYLAESVAFKHVVSRALADTDLRGHAVVDGLRWYNWHPPHARPSTPISHDIGEGARKLKGMMYITAIISVAEAAAADEGKSLLTKAFWWDLAHDLTGISRAADSTLSSYYLSSPENIVEFIRTSSIENARRSFIENKKLAAVIIAYESVLAKLSKACAGMGNVDPTRLSDAVEIGAQ